MPATPVRRPYAFTLIELLVVVAIIAMLISILLPSLSKARSMARMVKCASIQKQFGTAHHMYANESDDWFVPHTLNGTRLAWYRNIKWRANLSLSPGSNYPDGLVCPDVPEQFRTSAGKNYGGNGTADSSSPYDPNMTKVEDLPYNEGDYSTTATLTGIGQGRRTLRSRVKSPSEKLQLVDGADWNVSKWNANYAVHWDVYPELNLNEGGAWNVTSYRHNEGANILMFDGHAEYRTKQEAFDGSARDKLWDLYR